LKRKRSDILTIMSASLQVQDFIVTPSGDEISVVLEQEDYGIEMGV
jgi:hypothetical protein